MGYPMTYQRVVRRNQLDGDYDQAVANDFGSPDRLRAIIAGDLRRLEKDQRDDAHLKRYTRLAGISESQAMIILDALFGDLELPYLEET